MSSARSIKSSGIIQPTSSSNRQSLSNDRRRNVGGVRATRRLEQVPQSCAKSMTS